jgi:photosystem II stability/assembly factor-like uncharacterized protein
MPLASTQKAYVPSAIDNFFDVTSSGDTFWIAGSDGVLVKGDKQNKLKEIKINTREDLLSVSFSDPDHGWVVGTNGLVLKTLDGGRNWASVDTGINLRKLNLLAVKALPQETVLIAGEKGTIIRSTDGGKTWSNLFIPEDVNVSNINQIGGHLTAGGEFGTLFILKNDKWKKITVNKGTFKGDDWMNPEILTGVTDLGRERLGIVGTTGNAYVFNFRSESVESVKDVKVPLFSISKSNDVYVASGEFGKIFYSADFMDWKEAGKDVDLNIFIRSVKFLDGELSRGLAVGGYGVILTTNDGGRRWVKI